MPTSDSDHVLDLRNSDRKRALSLPKGAFSAAFDRVMVRHAHHTEPSPCALSEGKELH